MFNFLKKLFNRSAGFPEPFEPPPAWERPTRNGGRKITMKVDTNPATNPRIQEFDRYSYTETITTFKPRKKNRLKRMKRKKYHDSLNRFFIERDIDNLRAGLGL